MVPYRRQSRHRQALRGRARSSVSWRYRSFSSREAFGKGPSSRSQTETVRGWELVPTRGWLKLVPGATVNVARSRQASTTLVAKRTGTMPGGSARLTEDGARRRFTDLYRDTYRRVLAYALRRTADPDDADDADDLPGRMEAPRTATSSRLPDRVAVCSCAQDPRQSAAESNEGAETG